VKTNLYVKLTLRDEGLGSEYSPGPDIRMIDRLKTFQDLMGGGAWPILLGGMNCLHNSDNERDLALLTRGYGTRKLKRLHLRHQFGCGVMFAWKLSRS